MENKNLVPSEFGLQEDQAKTIESAFMPKIVERDGLKVIYEQLLTQEITPELCRSAGDLRKKLVKVRTGIAEIHKTQKAFFLAAGRFVDAWKNKETLPVEQMEEKLFEVEDYYAKIERDKVIALQQERSEELKKWQDELAFTPGNLGELTEEVWSNYLFGVKTAFEQKVAAEKAAKEAEEKRIADEKAEQERIRLENEKLKKAAEVAAAEKAKADAAAAELAEQAQKEREAAAAALAAEKAKADAAAAELATAQKAAADKAQAEAEAKRLEAVAEENRIQAELSKGDSEKVKDLIAYLSEAKTKFQFKSKKNQKMYSDVCILVDKIITHIQK